MTAPMISFTPAPPGVATVRTFFSYRATDRSGALIDGMASYSITRPGVTDLPVLTAIAEDIRARNDFRDVAIQSWKPFDGQEATA